jgi:hypothetical protein
LQSVKIIGDVYLTAFIVNALAEKFGSEKNLNAAFALIAYSYTPSFLITCVVRIIQTIIDVDMRIFTPISILYNLYLLYIGLPLMMKTSQEKKNSYFAVSVLCAVGVFFGLSLFVGFFRLILT